MRVVFFAVAAFCVLYYFILAVYSRKFTSTFAGFWLAAGGVHLVLGCVPPFSVAGKAAAAASAAAWILFFCVEIRILWAMTSGGKEKADCIIVLGAQVRGRKISDSLKRRLDRAVGYLQAFSETRVIVSGGQGPGEEITEADAMAEYLLKKGVEKSRIFREDKSTSTRENFRFSRAFADVKREKIGIVTNGFHIYRASLIAKEEGYEHIYTVPASSNPVYQLNYLVREFFALLHFFISHRRRGKR